MEKYAPTTLKEYQDGGMIEPISVDGKVMALPWTLVKTSKPVFAYRADLTKKFNVAVPDLTTIEGIDTFLTDAKKAGALEGLTGFDLNAAGGGARGDIVQLLSAKYEYQDMGFHSMFIDLNDPTNTVMPMEQTDMFKEAVTLAKNGMILEFYLRML